MLLSQLHYPHSTSLWLIIKYQIFKTKKKKTQPFLQLQREILFIQLNTRMKIQKQDENIGMFNILFQTTDTTQEWEAKILLC